MFFRNALVGLLALFHTAAFAGVQFKSTNLTVTAEAGKALDVPLRSLLSDEGTGNLTWFVLDPTPSWLTVDIPNERMTGNPTVSEEGTVNFRMSVQDGDSGSLANINVKVIVVPAWDDDPIDLGQIPEEVLFQLDLNTKLSYDGSGSLTFVIKDPSQKPGWLSLSSSGTLTGTPQRPDVGPTGNFEVTTTSPSGGEATVTVFGEVIKVNKPPAWTQDPTVLPNAQEDFAYTENLRNRVVDPDGDPITFTKVSGPAWLTVAANGDVSGTPTAAEIGLNRFEVKASDGLGGEDTAEVHITVENTNDPPVWSQNPIRIQVPEKQNMSENISSLVQDEDVGDILTFFKLSGAAWVKVSGTGVLTGIPTALGDHNVRVRADDQKGGTADVDVIITVVNVNDPPQWTQNPVRLPDAPERSLYQADVSSFAIDEDPGDSLTFSKISGPGWMSVAADGKVSGTPQRPDVGVNSFVVRVTDAAGLTADATVEVNVLKVNFPPEWNTDPINLADGLEDSPYVFDLSPFAEDKDGDTLTFSKISGPAWLTVAANGKLGGTPGAGDLGNFTAVFEITDGQATAQATGNGKVLMKNHPPKLKLEALNFIVKERQVLNVDLNQSQYVEDPNGDTLSWEVLVGDNWVNLSSTGSLTLSPLHPHIGDHTFRVKVSDPEGLSTEGELFVRVLRDPRPPVWSMDPIRFTAKARELFANTVADKVSDPDNVPLTFTKKSGPAWLTVKTDGTLEGTPGDSEVGDNDFVVTATNDALGADVDVIITVVEKNYPPEIKNIAFTIKERQNFQVSLDDPQYVEDNDGDPLVFTLLDTASWVTLSSNGDLFLNPLHEHVGDHQFRVRVTDGQDPVEGTLSVKVLRDPRPPVWSMNPIRFTAISRKLFRASVEDKVTELDGVELTFTKKSGPPWLTVRTDGTLEGTPQDEHLGDNTFVVTATNDVLGADVDVIVTVLQGNQDPFWTQNPIKLPNAIATKGYNQNVAPFAKDPDGDPLTFSKIEGPAWLNVATNGQLVGTPPLSAIGPNEFKVRVQDPDGAFADATVQIEVERPNNAPYWTQDPILLADAFTETSYQFDIAPFAKDDDGDVLTFSKINGPAWMSVAADGVLSGVPQTPDIGDYTAVFEVTDGRAKVQVAAVGRVLRKNDPPTINAENLKFTVKEREVFKVNLDDPLYVQDPDGDPLTFTLIDSAPWVELTSDGNLTLSPEFPHIGGHKFRFSVTDGKLGDQATIEVTVIRDPRPPVWAENPIRFETIVRQPFDATVADKVTDLDGLPLTFSKKSGPSWMSVAPDGKLSGTPQDPDLGENPFVIVARNDVLGAEVNVVVNVITDNKPPYWTQDPIRLPDAEPDTTYAESVASFAKDPEGEALTFEKVAGASWAFITTSGLIIGTPSESDGGMNTLTVRVKDPHGAFADATVQINVDGGAVNTPPRWTDDPIDLGSALIDAAFGFDLAKFAVDDDGDALSFRKISGPGWLFTSTGGQLSGVPRISDLGGFTAVFEVSDGKASARVDAFGKVVDSQNNPPQLKPEALSFIVKERQVFQVDLNQPQYVEDPDGDPLTWELLVGDTWVDLTSDGKLTLTPKHEHLGDHNFRVRVTDSTGLFDEGPLFVRVIPDPRPPIWLEDPIRFTAYVDENFSENIRDKAQDLDNLPLTFSKKSGPAWLIVGGGGALSGTPRVSDLGTNTFVVTVSNGSASADAAVIIEVKRKGGPIEDEIIVDEAVPGAPAENLWVIDNSWPWIGKNWLIQALDRHIHVYYDLLDNAQIHHTGVYISSDVKRWKALPVQDASGFDLFAWKDSNVPGRFRYRLGRTKTDNCYNSPVWSMFRFYQQASGLDIYKNGYFTENTPMDAMIVTKHKDTYRHYAHNTPQARWRANDYADNFIDFHQKNKQSLRISAVAPECPTLLNPHEGDPGATSPGNENPYQVLVKRTKGVYYPADCNINMPKILTDYAKKVIFRAYVHAKDRIPLSKTPLDPSSIEVSLGGVVLSGNTGSASDLWSYDSARNEVVVFWHKIDLSTVNPGDRLKIRYVGA